MCTVMIPNELIFSDLNINSIKMKLDLFSEWDEEKIGLPILLWTNTDESLPGWKLLMAGFSKLYEIDGDSKVNDSCWK